jgi:hypothetical protein
MKSEEVEMVSGNGVRGMSVMQVEYGRGFGRAWGRRWRFG